jgi:hypothetical protein
LTDRQKRAEIKRLLDKWMEVAYLQLWKYRLRFSNRFHPESNLYVADVSCIQPEYKTFRIRFYLPAITKEVKIEQYVIHEIVHIVLTDYDYLIENECLAYPESSLIKARENTTEHITKIILKLVGDD